MPRRPRRNAAQLRPQGPEPQIKDKRNPGLVLADAQRNAMLLQFGRGEGPYRDNERGMNRAIEALHPRFNPGNDAYEFDMEYIDHHGRGIRAPPKGSAYARGDYTGAVRAPHPPVRRHFGGNTRQTVYPFERQGTKLTGLLDNHYDPRVINPPGNQRASHGFLPSGAVPIQAGTPTVLRGIHALRPGSHHPLFT